ncbi:MAG: hypothetical protein S0880_31730 [Actinomycetota bacterium]|nr:hypothetical protein [Actinomycetota bacterium]
MRQLAPPRCPTCRSWLPRESSFCARCGASTGDAGGEIVLDGEANLPRERPASEPTTGERRTATDAAARRGWAALAALLVAVVLVGFVPDVITSSGDDAAPISVPTDERDPVASTVALRDTVPPTDVEPGDPSATDADAVDPPATTAGVTDEPGGGPEAGRVPGYVVVAEVPAGLEGRRLQVGDEERGIVAEVALVPDGVLVAPIGPVPVTGTARVWPETTAVRLRGRWLLRGANADAPQVDAIDLVGGPGTVWAWQRGPDGADELVAVAGPAVGAATGPWPVPGGTEPVVVTDTGLVVRTRFGAELHLVDADGGDRLLARGGLVAASPAGLLVRQCGFEQCEVVVVGLDGSTVGLRDADGSPLDVSSPTLTGAVSPDGRWALLPSSAYRRDVAVVDLTSATITHLGTQSWEVIRGLAEGRVVWDPAGRHAYVPGRETLGVLDTTTGDWWELALDLPLDADLDLVIPLPER